MESSIDALEPLTRAMAESLLAACPDIRITSTLRTNAEQQEIWELGRSLEHGLWVVVDKSKVVTKAKPGESAHNFGAAFDICFRGKDPYFEIFEKREKKSHPRWLEVGTLGEEIGLVWGGPRGARDRFTFDRPHFERADWKTLRESIA